MPPVRDHQKNTRPGGERQLLPTYDYGSIATITDEVSVSAALERGLFHTLHAEWSTDEKELPDPDPKAEVISTYRSAGTNFQQRVDVHAQAVCALKLSGGQFNMMVAARGTDQCERLLKRFRGRMSESVAKEGDIPVRFWYDPGDGARSFSRRIAVPNLGEIKKNYPSRVYGELGRFGGWDPTEQGKLLIWTGPVGTGKTYALRAMINAWRQWSAVNYITDPENFLVSPGYMMQVLANDTETMVGEDDSDESGDAKHNLLILEDAGELLSSDAGERTRGLGRLLNLADGMLGQGIKMAGVITTNEEVKRLHPAISRPGRCAGHIEFENFSPAEADKWLGERRNVSMSLAELYAAKQGFEAPAVDATPKVGFGA